MTLTALPIFVKLAGRPVMLIGTGEAAEAKRRLLERAGARVVGVGAVIAKAFQPGMRKLREAGYRVEALAAIRRLGEGIIEFEE